jgi:hypothetical protein
MAPSAGWALATAATARRVELAAFLVHPNEQTRPMRAESKTNLRGTRSFAGGALLLIVIVVCWRAVWDNGVSHAPADPPSTPRKSRSAEFNAHGTTTALATASQPTPQSAASDTLAGEAGTREIQEVQARLIAARNLLREVEARFVKRVMTKQTETNVIDHVHLPALTREQLDPVYTQLSQAGRDFPAGSAGAKLFREEADKFLFSLRALPAKHAMRTTNKQTGAVSYAITLLAEDATVNAAEDGSLDISAARINAVTSATPDDAGHLFRADTGPQSP